MYLDYFKLKEMPFNQVTDPRFVYMSPNHARVKAFIQFALNVQDSFVVITGEIGSGKTTLINTALTSIENNQKILINIQALNYQGDEFLQTVLLESGVKPYGLSKLQILENLKAFLINQHRAGKKVYLIVDEAQNLSKNDLNDVRYLADLELETQKLLNIILVAQPELNAVLDQPDMEHFLQRVRLRTHLRALEAIEVQPYVRHRLKVAGAKSTELFETEAFETLYLFTEGRMRLINTLCDYALMYCCVEKEQKVSAWIIQKAAQELQWEPYDVRFGQHKDATRMQNVVRLEPQKAKLLVSRQGQIISEHMLEKESLSIGRHSANDIQLDSQKVSRKHAQLVKQEGQYFLHDLGSTNGTLMDDQKISVRKLTDGCEFVIDQFKFSFIAVAPASSEVDLDRVVDITRTRQISDTRIRGKSGTEENVSKQVKVLEKENP